MRWIFIWSFFLPFVCLSQQVPGKLIKPSTDNEIEKLSPAMDEKELLWFCDEVAATVNFNEWRQYLENKIILDSASMDTIPPGRYTVFCKFLIDEKGGVSDFTTTTDPGFGLGQRVINGMKNYNGKWKPATLHGKAIKSYRIQAITFIVEEEEECENELPSALIL